MAWLGLVARKVGMSRIFLDNGNPKPVTILKVLKAAVIGVLTPAKEGYGAIRVGYEPVSAPRIRKPLRGVYDAVAARISQANKNASAEPESSSTVATCQPSYFRRMLEFRTHNPAAFSLGEAISADLVEVGDKVDAVGWTKGRGFQGVVKRHRFRGGKDSHGTSVVHRRPMSIGCRWPQRVLPGKRMAGHMGNERLTIKNLVVLKKEDDLLYVLGSVPGAREGLVILRPAKGWGGHHE